MAGRSWLAADSGWPLRVALRRQYRRWSDTAWNLLLPPGCAACGVPLNAGGRSMRLCRACRVVLAASRGASCRRCGALADDLLVGADGCPRCRRRRLRFEGVVSLGTYEGPLRRALLRMKRPAGESLAIAVAHLLCDRAVGALAAQGLDVVVPIPMYWRRRLVRGANSAEIVAEVIGRRLHLPVARRLLVRRRKTKPQFSLHPHDRFRNVRGAFRVAGGYHLQAARILLVDDILTTGATCSEATKALLAAGGASASVAVVARAEGM